MSLLKGEIWGQVGLWPSVEPLSQVPVNHQGPWGRCSLKSHVTTGLAVPPSPGETAVISFLLTGAPRLGCHFPEGTDDLRGSPSPHGCGPHQHTLQANSQLAYPHQCVYSQGKPSSKLQGLEESQASNGHNPKSGSCPWARGVSLKLRAHFKVDVLWRKQGRQWV